MYLCNVREYSKMLLTLVVDRTIAIKGDLVDSRALAEAHRRSTVMTTPAWSHAKVAPANAGRTPGKRTILNLTQVSCL
jgi:hypothetical protein